MREMEVKVGARVIVSTADGDETDEVTRVLADGDQAGVWIVETARNGRVVVLRGTTNGYQLSADSY